MPYATAKDGTRLYYKDWGEGRPVVLIHGWPLSGDTFDDAAVALAESGLPRDRPRPPRVRALGPAVGRLRLRHLRRRRRRGARGRRRRTSRSRSSASRWAAARSRGSSPATAPAQVSQAVLIGSVVPFLLQDRRQSQRRPARGVRRDDRRHQEGPRAISSAASSRSFFGAAGNRSATRCSTTPGGRR